MISVSCVLIQNSVYIYIIIYRKYTALFLWLIPWLKLSSHHSPGFLPRTVALLGMYFWLTTQAKTMEKRKGTAVAVALSIVLSIPPFEELKVRRAVQNETWIMMNNLKH